MTHTHGGTAMLTREEVYEISYLLFLGLVA